MKALITAPFHESGLKLLANHMEVAYENWRETGELYRDPDDYVERIRAVGANVLISEGDDIVAQVLEQCDIKMIGITRGYPDNVDVDAARGLGIPIFFAPGRNAHSAAEHTVTLILAQLRKLTAIDRLLSSGDFYVDTGQELGHLYSRFRGVELGGKTIGIIGFGGIGSRVARRLHFGFGCPILIHDPYIRAGAEVEVSGVVTDLETLLRKSDVVTLHARVTDETLDMIGAEQLALMKPTAYLINTARAALVDEDALFGALQEERIAGAGLDVFGIEPVDSDNQFLELDNVTVTPHIGGTTVEQELRQTEMIASDMIRFLTGERPLHLLNPEVFPRKGG